MHFTYYIFHSLIQYNGIYNNYLKLQYITGGQCFPESTELFVFEHLQDFLVCRLLVLDFETNMFSLNNATRTISLLTIQIIV